MKILRLLHFCCSVPASGAELEREKSELFWPRDCHKFPPALQRAVMLGCAGDVAFPTSSSSKQQLSCCPLQQEHQTRLFTALFPFPFLPGFQPHLSFQARGASPWHGLLYGYQHSVSSVWQMTLYLTHNLIMTSCLSNFLLPFHMDRNFLFHVLLSPSAVEQCNVLVRCLFTAAFHLQLFTIFSRWVTD